MSYNLTEEELHEVRNWMPKAEQLVRLGMLPVAQLPYIKRALTAIQTDAFLPLIIRKPFYRFLDELLELAMGEPGIYRLIRNKVAANRNNAVINRYMPEEIQMEDQEQLDELSKETHVKYQNAAYDDANSAYVKHARAHNERPSRRISTTQQTLDKRGKGIERSEKLSGVNRWGQPATDFRGRPVKKYSEEGIVLDGETLEEAKTAFKKLLRPNFYKDEKHKENDTETKAIADKAHSKAEVTEDVDYRKTPLGMLQTLAGMVKMKKRSGGKVAANDRIQATKARNEIRRRKYFGEGLDTTFLDVADALANQGIILNEMQLDELSKRHMAAYIEKSAADLSARSDTHGATMAKAGMREKGVSMRPFTPKIKKRFRGIVNASHKLASEEVEQIDELSKETKASYVKKANKDHSDRFNDESLKSWKKGKGLKFDMDDIDPKDSHKIEKREKGVKMAKEEKETPKTPIYSKDAVDKSIASSNRSGKRIGKKEGKSIHRLLKGRTNEEVEQIDESYQLRFTAALEKFGVQNFAELDDTSAKDFLAYVDTQNEAVVMAGRGGSLPMSADMKSQVAKDMEKRKAAKEAILQSAKADVANKDIKRKGGLLALPKDYDRDTSQDKKKAGQR